MSNIVPLVAVTDVVNSDAIELVEEVLSHLRSGEAVAVAIVEVLKAGNVATSYCASQSYHQLNSGAARLAARLASEPSDA